MSPALDAAREVLGRTAHQRSTKQAALDCLGDSNLSIRAAARRWSVAPSNVLRALRKVPEFEGQNAKRRPASDTRSAVRCDEPTRLERIRHEVSAATT